jgi:alpha-L-fucosidase 2
MRRRATILRVVILCANISAHAGPPRSVAVGATTSQHDKDVAEKAQQIVASIHGIWQKMPADIVTSRMTSGALIGNGSVGVAIGGTPDKQQFYIGRDDFWSVLRGSIMPVGRLQLAIPQLEGGSSQISENIGPADVTGSFSQSTSQLRTKSWVAAGQNTYTSSLRIRASRRCG